ncbi:hypothetical protein ACFWNK_38565 [Streptomyces sp. NPDC058417]|uniref:hypothetical protein n=1 Tax=unclassified Streptomyces TaxID=2593676 RepID=UPI003669BF89
MGFEKKILTGVSYESLSEDLAREDFKNFVNWANSVESLMSGEISTKAFKSDSLSGRASKLVDKALELVASATPAERENFSSKIQEKRRKVFGERISLDGKSYSLSPGCAKVLEKIEELLNPKGAVPNPELGEVAAFSVPGTRGRVSASSQDSSTSRSSTVQTPPTSRTTNSR